MLGSSAAREAGSAPLSLQQTAPHEDQENINPEKASPAQQPRTRARLAALKAVNQRAPAPPQRPKTRRVPMSVVPPGVRQGRGARRHAGFWGGLGLPSPDPWFWRVGRPLGGNRDSHCVFAACLSSVGLFFCR